MLTHHPCTDGHLGCLHLWAAVNNAAVNMGIQYLFESLLLNLWGICGIIRPSGNSLLTFEGPPHRFPQSCMGSHAHRPCTGAPVSPRPRQRWLEH